MSVFQYIYFAAGDKPLDDKQLEYMRHQSTRAEVTRWQFTNEYHYRVEERQTRQRGCAVDPTRMRCRFLQRGLFRL